MRAMPMWMPTRDGWRTSGCQADARTRRRSTRSPTMVPSGPPVTSTGQAQQHEEPEAVDRPDDRHGGVVAVDEGHVGEHDEQQRVGDAHGQGDVQKAAAIHGRGR